MTGRCLRRDYVKRQCVGRSVQRRNGSEPRPVQSAGVDDPRLADAVVAFFVGVPVEDVIHFHRRACRFKTPLVSVENGDPFSVERDLGRPDTRRGEPGRLEESKNAPARNIGVAPDHRTSPADQLIEHFQSANVAAMDDVLDPQPVEKRHRLLDRRRVSMTIRKNPDQHVHLLPRS